MCTRLTSITLGLLLTCGVSPLAHGAHGAAEAARVDAAGGELLLRNERRHLSSSPEIIAQLRLLKSSTRIVVLRSQWSDQLV